MSTHLPRNHDGRILIVDDDGRHADSVAALLSAEGHRAEVRTRGADGLEALVSASPEARYDVLLLDLNIPDLSGLEILEALRAQNVDVYTVIISGESSLRQVTPVLRLGANDYLAKPFEPDRLIASVRNGLERRALERENAAIQERIAASERLHAFLVNASPDLIYMLDENGNISFTNNRLSSIFKVNQDVLLGRPWREVVVDSLAERIDQRFDERRTGERATHHYEVDAEDVSGEVRILELSATGLYQDEETLTTNFTGTYGVVRDVTDSRRTARRLAESRRKFYGLFMNSPDAVFISRLGDARLLEVNDKFMTMLRGFGGADMERDLALWGAVENREQFVAELTQSPHRYAAVYELVTDGDARSFEVTGRMIDVDGESCLMATVRDLTLQKRAEQDRLVLEKQLQQASKMEAIGQLAGGIAHDFNNILASIIGYTELALTPGDRLSRDQIGGYLKEVIAAGQRARDLISQMLTFTRAHRGNPVPLDVEDTIVEVSRMLRAAIPTPIAIEQTFEPGLPTVEMDPVQLQQVLMNLLINARDSIRGAGRISVAAARRDVADTCLACGGPISGAHVELSVGDTGHGISPEVLPRIFDMFVTTREPGQGSGFGLWLIQTIVHEYGGHIGAETSPGSGTTFRVYLPFGADVTAVDEHASPDVHDSTRRDNASGTIVVVDDEVSVSNFIGEVLRNAGYHVAIFNDSPLAVAHIEDHADDVTLVITDQAMPQVTGLELVTVVRERRPNLPVILITGYAEETDRRQLERLGVERFLAKPFRIDELLRSVNELTAESAQ